MVPTNRIYLFTYKRHNLLPRAVQSLLAQTLEDWVCEVHNDCPGDLFPEQYITSLNDPRFIIKNHETNLGPTASFNLAFAGCPEKYVSILEDDNWWEPGFLKRMSAIMDENPALDVAWSNMRIWKEQQDGSWGNTGKTTWDIPQTGAFYDWPNNLQALGALHSIGAMIYRGEKAKDYLIPANCESAIIEHIRERTFKFPIFLSGEPLANFSQTLQTSRSDKSWIWTSCQIMLLASFVNTAKDYEKTFEETLSFYRRQKPSPVANFFLMLFFLGGKTKLLKYFSLNDWYVFSIWMIKNNLKLIKIQQYLKQNRNVYQFLQQHTSQLYNHHAGQALPGK
jgi:glycosyltransferase involved in cell wall biosynthesis